MRRLIGLTLLFALPALPASNAYIQHNLIADTPGVADLTDPNLVNPWAIATSATGPFWISDNGTGLATVYSTSATATIAIASLKVTIPPGAASGAGPGPVTGQLSNTTTVFLNGTTKASFLFCTADGTISAWNSGTLAVIKVDNSSKGAVYKGMALGGTSTAPQLYVANFHAGTVEVYDGNFAPVTTLAKGAFTDAQVPSGFAPFNIVNLNGALFVAYAKQDTYGVGDVAGPGNGYVDIFDMSGNLTTRLIAGGVLNSPWGMAIAPANFGTFANMLLVGNFGNGRINAFDPVAGTSLGALQDPTGAAIVISGLWALQDGNGKSGGDANAVYFAAGPGNQLHGLLGSLQAAPVLRTSNPVVNGADFLSGGVAQYAWVTVFGSNMSSTTRSWQAADIVNGKLPTQLDGVGVTVDGKPAYISFISPTQVNALVAADFTLGTVQVQTTNKTLTSGSTTATMQATSPAFFISSGNYAAALHANNSIVAPTTVFASATPAQPGETIEFYATGFGPGTTTIPDGQTITTAIPVTGVTVTIGNANATVTFAGLVGPGLYQINATVPASTPNGDAALSAAIGGQTTQAGVLVSVHN